MASIKTDQAPNGLCNAFIYAFKAAALHLLPYDPMQKERTDRPGKKRDHADTSNTTGKEVGASAFGAE
jgi:hypothetical protein